MWRYPHAPILPGDSPLLNGSNNTVNLHANAQGGMGPVFSQLFVRQAIQEAINQKAIDQSVDHGYYAPRSMDQSHRRRECGFLIPR